MINKIKPKVKKKEVNGIFRLFLKTFFLKRLLTRLNPVSVKGTGFYWVFLRLQWNLHGIYWIHPWPTGFYWGLLGFTGFYRVLMGFNGFDWV